MVKHTVKATRTQVREFLSFWELTRQISRWFLFVGFLFRGIVLYGSWQNFAKVKPPSFVQIFPFPSSLSQKHIRQPRQPRQVVFSCSILLLFRCWKEEATIFTINLLIYPTKLQRVSRGVYSAGLLRSRPTSCVRACYTCYTRHTRYTCYTCLA